MVKIPHAFEIIYLYIFPKLQISSINNGKFRSITPHRYFRTQHYKHQTFWCLTADTGQILRVVLCPRKQLLLLTEQEYWQTPQPIWMCDRKGNPYNCLQPRIIINLDVVTENPYCCQKRKPLLLPGIKSHYQFHI
jgi:hypothetical protein